MGNFILSNLTANVPSKLRRTSSTAVAQRNNVPHTYKNELGKPFDCILVKTKE